MERSLAVITPVGRYELAVASGVVTQFSYIDSQRAAEVAAIGNLEIDSLMGSAVTQLSEYFGGQRSVFELPLELQGTEFQKSVWITLLQVPFGSVVSYAELAEMCGKPRAARAVGNALNKNRFGILIPCHRVLAAGGKLGGFGMGLETKRLLLAHEQVSYSE